MNPRILKAYEKTYKTKLNEQNYMNYLMGLYQVSALQCTVGNMFKSKGSKSIEYMDKPIELFPNKEKISSEEEQAQVDLFFAEQSIMRANWKRTHKN